MKNQSPKKLDDLTQIICLVNSRAWVDDNAKPFYCLYIEKLLNWKFPLEPDRVPSGYTTGVVCLSGFSIRVT